MNIVGYVFLALIALAILIGIAFVLSSADDIARYQRMRRM